MNSNELNRVPIHFTIPQFHRTAGFGSHEDSSHHRARIRYVQCKNTELPSGRHVDESYTIDPTAEELTSLTLSVSLTFSPSHSPTHSFTHSHSETSGHS
jgi:hypothetical protein